MKELTLPAAVESIETATDIINEELEALGCSLKAQMQIDIAVDEILGNIAHYAYAHGTGDVTVRMEASADGRTVTLTFTDGGVPYDPLAAEEPDVTLSAEEREIGGLGIFMVKKTMDEMMYEYRDGKNIFSVKKKIKND